MLAVRLLESAEESLRAEVEALMKSGSPPTAAEVLELVARYRELTNQALEHAEQSSRALDTAEASFAAVEPTRPSIGRRWTRCAAAHAEQRPKLQARIDELKAANVRRKRGSRRSDSLAGRHRRRSP